MILPVTPSPMPDLDKLLADMRASDWSRMGRAAQELESLAARLRATPELELRVPLAFFHQTPIQPGDAALLEATVFCSCRVEHLIVAERCARFRLGLRVGCVSQASDCNLVSAEFFVPNAQGEAFDRLFVNRWNTDVCPVAAKLFLEVRNDGPQPETFEAIAWTRHTHGH